MPRYYFDIRKGFKFIPDPDGLPSPDLAAAERKAAETAGTISRDLLPKADARDVTIDVRNEHDQRVLITRVTMDVERVVPLPLPPT